MKYLLLLILSIPASALHITPPPANGQPLTPTTIDATGDIDTTGSVLVDNIIAFSSVPVQAFCGGILAGTLATGTTFLAFTPDSAVTLRRIGFTVGVAGIGGSGDTITCNNSTGTGISLTVAAAAAAGTYTTGSGSANIAYQAAISCHIEGGATTKPIGVACVEYTHQ